MYGTVVAEGSQPIRRHRLDCDDIVAGTATTLEPPVSCEDLCDTVEQLCGADISREHPLWTLEGWKVDVAGGDTDLGYWAWVAQQSLAWRWRY